MDSFEPLKPIGSTRRCSLILSGVIGLAATAPALVCAADPTESVEARLTIDVNAPGRPVPATLHGIFFEDINYGADGGLYAELVQNRSFEHPTPLYAWHETSREGGTGKLEIADDSPLNANNTHFLRIDPDNRADGSYGVANTGFDGMALAAEETYLVSLYARSPAGEATAVLVRLEDSTGHVIAEHQFAGLTSSWTKLEAELTGVKSISDGQLAVLVTGTKAVDVDMISLFPKHTFKERRNGLRRDLAQALADLKPGFLRFPGGCIVEGMDLSNAYRWKDTIGDIAERKQNWNLWRNDESPEYCQTYGLGFFEFFQLCEDIGAEPVPVVNCGMCCQARRRGTHVPLDQLGPWIQDALDLIEFANGPADSEWGAKRAAMGHPEPFHLKFLAVGNEQWSEEYFARYDLFQQAIKHRYPEIAIISTSGPHPDDPLWEFAWNKFRTGTPADVVDEHYYVQPSWLLKNVDRYASYDRRGPKIFVGEFAAHDGSRRNSLRAALAESAYMTGLVRHSDVVLMASYAPLFGKYGHAQWRPNLIWFDNRHVVRTPSYYAQALFAQNRPDFALPIEVSAPEIQPQPAGMVGVGTWNTQAEFRHIKVSDAQGRLLFQSNFDTDFEGWKTFGGTWRVKDGALQQSEIRPNTYAVVGDPAWRDYTLTLQARRLGGEEGFLILFHTADTRSPTWWNLGGYRNTAHVIQNGDVTERRIPGKIESDRWYDIRIELARGSVKAFLDGQLVHDETIASLPALYAAAGRDGRTGELVLQLVNPFSASCPVQITLSGAKLPSGDGRLVTLSHADPATENTLEVPDAVAPRESKLTVIGAEFRHVVPPHSVQILRLPLNEH